MDTKTDICNLALFRAGSGATIENFDTNRQQEGNLCRLVYPQALEEVLREHPWRFARRRVVLADTGIPPSNWGFSYTYPTDCLLLLTLVLPGMRWPRWDMRPPFEVASDGTKTVIYADLEQAEAVYTGTVDEARFDPLFVSALAWRMAAELARTLAGKMDAGNTAEQQYRAALSRAAARDLGEAWEGPEPESEFLAARR